MQTTLHKAPRAIRFLEFCAQPITKADLARDAADFKEACERAEKKGDRARELIDQCIPDPARVLSAASDFEVKI